MKEGIGFNIECVLCEEPCTDPYARFCGHCALQAHEVQQSEMTAPAKPSQQPGTESCVVFGNDHCEA